MERPQPHHPVALVAVRAAPARRRWFDVAAWVPLGVLAVVLLLASLGLRLDPAAFGVSTGNNDIVVGGSVDKEVHLSAAGCATAGALDLGTLVPDDPAAETTADCAIVFGTNNTSAGADLTVREDPLAPSAGDAMKCVSATCTGDSLLDYSGAGMPAAGNSAFAMRLNGTSGATAVWSTSTDPTGTVYDVADAADTACTTTSMADGTCNFRFTGMAASATDQVGSYQAQVQFIALAK